MSISDQALEFFIQGDRYRAARQFHRAVRAYGAGLKLCPNTPAAILNYSSLLLATRSIDKSVRILLEAVRRYRDFQPLQSNLLTVSLYSPKLSGKEVASLHFEWGQAAASAQIRLPHRDRRGPRKLRIGYLSANFCTNPENFFSKPLFGRHDLSRFEIYLYSTAVRPDAQTETFRGICNVFRPIATLTDMDACRTIAEDRIDILVDLSGHFGGGRMGVLAAKPAPIQVSFPTYPATTGLAAVDYRIGDARTDPPRTSDKLYSESIVRLRRCYCCYEIPTAPLVRPLPAIQNGFVTFGVFNRPHKITDDFLRVCAAILKQAPGSKLYFHHTYNGNGNVSKSYRRAILRTLGLTGTESGRILFLGGLPFEQHLSAISQADIALDTFPYNGMTTTCECYWMGVPVVTLCGDAHASRVGTSLAFSTGLQDWVATDTDSYVRTAVGMTNNLRALGNLRQTLRSRLKESDVMDAKGYARSIEGAYITMWRRYLQNGGARARTAK